MYIIGRYLSTADISKDIALRLATLPPPRSASSYPLHIQNPISLPQLAVLLTLLNQSLDIIDISTWTGDAQDASFIAGQLRLLADSIDEARQTLKGGEDVVGGKWWDPREADDVSCICFSGVILSNPVGRALMVQDLLPTTSTESFDAPLSH